MRRLFKIKREKSPKPPRQPIPPPKPVDIAARPPGSRTELDVIPEGGRNLSPEDVETDRTDPAMLPDEGGREGPQVLIQDGTDGVQELLALGASTSRITIGSAGCGDQPTGEWFRSPRLPRILANLCFTLN